MHVVFVAASQRGLPQEGGAAAGGGGGEVLRMRRGERGREQWWEQRGEGETL